MSDQPNATKDNFDAKAFDFARQLARQGKEVPGSTFLMLEAARQYHMDAINRIARSSGALGKTSEQVADEVDELLSNASIGMTFKTVQSATTRLPAEPNNGLRDAVIALLNVIEMEQHNEDIFKGKWKKGSKAWSGSFVEKMRKEAIENSRSALSAAPSQAEQPAAREDYTANYMELLYEVARKFPGESRHQTALRYIRQAEEQAQTAEASSATDSEKAGG